MAQTDKPRLLVVDDEPDMLDYFQRVLRRKYEVIRANGPDDALRRLQADPFDVVVTDQKMPRMTGLELLEQIRESHPDIVKVLVSGFTELPDIQRAIEQGGVHAYILKPVDGQRLLEGIEEAYEVRDGKPPETPE